MLEKIISIIAVIIIATLIYALALYALSWIGVFHYFHITLNYYKGVTLCWISSYFSCTFRGIPVNFFNE